MINILFIQFNEHYLLKPNKTVRV